MSNLLRRIEALEQRLAVREASDMEIASLLLQAAEVHRKREVRGAVLAAFMLEFRAWCLAGYGLENLIASSYHTRGCQCAVCVPWSHEVRALVAANALAISSARHQ